MPGRLVWWLVFGWGVLVSGIVDGPGGCPCGWLVRGFCVCRRGLVGVGVGGTLLGPEASGVPALPGVGVSAGPGSLSVVAGGGWWWLVV